MALTTHRDGHDATVAAAQLGTVAKEKRVVAPHARVLRRHLERHEVELLRERRLLANPGGGQSESGGSEHAAEGRARERRGEGQGTPRTSARAAATHFFRKFA